MNEDSASGASPSPSRPAAPPAPAAPSPEEGVSGARWWLVCFAGPDEGKRARVGEQPVRLGADASCGVVCQDPAARPEHVSLRRDGEGVRVEPGEEAPVFLDGVRLTQPAAMEGGGQLRIGASYWRLDLCSGPPPLPEPSPVPESASRFAVDNWGMTSVSKAAGIPPLKECFRFRSLLAGVREKRSLEEIEECFALGTAHTTPPIDQIEARWPRPWLFSRALILFVGVFLGFALGWKMFENVNLLPGLMITGSIAVPLAVLILFFEANMPRNVSFYQVVKLLLVGGILSLFATMLGFHAVNLSFLGAAAAGLIEEPAKLAALLIVAGNRRYRWTLNGLLLGGAVGAGFAIFESAGYAFAILLQGGIDAMLGNITLRGLLSPGGHVAWTALAGAALWKVKGDRKFEPGMLADTRFLRVFALVVVMHMLWNSPLQLPLFGTPILLTVVAWFAVLMFMQDGIEEVRRAREAAETAGAEEGGSAADPARGT